MRWFKHMTFSGQDEKLVALKAKFGLEGYGFFWSVLEFIAAQVDENDKNFCEYPEVFWRKSLGVSAKKLEEMLTFCQLFKIFTVEKTENGIKVASPNILKFRDEWTRKKSKNSGVTPESLRSKDTDTDTDTEADKDIKTISPEPAEPSAGAQEQPAPEAVITLPLNTGAEHPVTRGEIDQWAALYPAVNVEQALRNMKGWLIGNSTRRKTRAGIGKFIQAWLAKEQDSPRSPPPSARVGPSVHGAVTGTGEKRVYEQPEMPAWMVEAANGPDAKNRAAEAGA